jgi:hypothetical protein
VQENTDEDDVQENTEENTKVQENTETANTDM